VTRSFEGRRSGKPLPGTLGAEAERLAKVGSNAGRVIRIKTDDAHSGMIARESAKPPDMRSSLEGKAAGLVAGNVTGGGGKATRTKT
jgi:hypothetical protein